MQEQGGKGGMIENIDQMLGAVAEALAQGPGGDKMAQRMQALQAEFRSIVMEAQGGGGQGSPSPQADQSQGMPVSPAGYR